MFAIIRRGFNWVEACNLYIKHSIWKVLWRKHRVIIRWHSAYLKVITWLAKSIEHCIDHSEAVKHSQVPDSIYVYLLYIVTMRLFYIFMYLYISQYVEVSKFEESKRYLFLINVSLFVIYFVTYTYNHEKHCALPVITTMVTKECSANNLYIYI